MSFREFLSNERALAEIRQMLAGGRAPGAMLFSGPEGVGKKTLAMMLAKALNCERAQDDYCGECGHCLQIEKMLRAAEEDLARRREIKDAKARVESLLYYDVQLIAPITRHILIEQIRALLADAFARPFELSKRVFILDEAEAIHWQAMDLLLKVLEEPPPTTHLILICRNPFELRTTIRSRCRQVQFLPAEDAVIERILRDEAKAPEPKLSLAVRVVGGSIGAARQFNLREYEERRRPWLEYLEAVAGKSAQAADWRRAFAASKALAEDRSAWNETLTMGALLAADLLHVAANDNPARLVNVDIVERLRAWAKAIGFRGIATLHDGLAEAYRLQIRNVNPELGLDALAVELA